VIWKGGQTPRFVVNEGAARNLVQLGSETEFSFDRRAISPMASIAGKPEASDHTVTKAELIEEVIRITELPRKESETVVETVFESIIEALQKNDKIEIRGFGSFRTRQRRGRIGRNPKTGAKVEVPPKRIPFFKPSKELKDFVNSHPSSPASSEHSPQG
jgi:integration host factor subunit beta